MPVVCVCIPESVIDLLYWCVGMYDALVCERAFSFYGEMLVEFFVNYVYTPTIVAIEQVGPLERKFLEAIKFKATTRTVLII